MNTLSINQDLTLTRKLWHSLKMLTLFIFWHYGLLILFFTAFCCACYLYLDTALCYLLSPDVCDQVQQTPAAGKVVVVLVAGRRVAVRMNRKVRAWKAKYIKGE